MTLATQTAKRKAAARHHLARILIVDDDVDFAESLSEMLDLQGHETRIATTAREGLRQMKVFAPDLALLDIRLGHDSGLDVLAKLQKSHREIDAFMLTAHASLDTAIEAVRHGAYDYLRKPIDSSELFVALERCLAKRQLERDKRDAEDALAQSEARFRASFEQSSVGIALMTIEGRFKQVNSKLCDILGYEPEEMLRISFRDVAYPDDLDGTIKPMKALLAGDLLKQTWEKQCNRKNQESVWVSFTISLVHYAAGTPVDFLIVAEDITERKRSEEALRENEARLRLLSDALPVGICYVDTEYRYRFANKTYGEWHGIDPEDIVGKTTLEVLGAEALKVASPSIDRALSGKQSNFETRVPYKIAGTRDVQIISVPNFAENGKIVGAYAMVIDISERKRAEAEAAEAHALLAEAMESNPDAIVLYDADDRLVLFNKAFNKGLLSDLSDLIKPGISFEELVRAAVERGLLLVPDGNTEDYIHTRVEHHRAGEENLEVEMSGGRWMLLRERRMPGGGIIGTRTDITERKRAEIAIRESEERFRAVIDNSPMAFLLKDTHGRIQLANQTFLNWYGMTLAEIFGKTSLELFPKDFANTLVAQDRKVIKLGKTFESELKTAFNDGFMHSIVVSKFPVFDGDRRIIGIGGISIDVTEQRKIEEQLRQAQKMEVVGQLTGGVAHDFNNLLTVILGNLDLLSDSIKDDPAASELIDAALQACLRSADLTQQLLAFSRKQTLNPQPIDVNERLPIVVGLMKRTIGENIDVETELAERLPKALVDESQLESAILNLAINARDSMPTGGRLTITTGSISIRKSRSGDRANLTPGRYVTICVTDNGTGMSPDVIEHAFEPFFTTKEVGEGSGLGLSMVYGFARQSGGDLEIRSELGKGTTIELLLPVAKDAHKSPANSRRAPRGFPTGTETVLVVEDQPQVRSFIVTVLRRLGYTVLHAANGSEAIALAKKTSAIDLVLTDLVLPGGMNGYEIVRQVRKQITRTKVVYTSGYSRGTVETDDSNAFLVKPFGRKALADGRKALADTVRLALDTVNA